MTLAAAFDEKIRKLCKFCVNNALTKFQSKIIKNWSKTCKNIKLLKFIKLNRGSLAYGWRSQTQPLFRWYASVFRVEEWFFESKSGRGLSSRRVVFPVKQCSISSRLLQFFKEIQVILQIKNIYLLHS